MGFFDKDGLTHSGYGGMPHLSEWGAMQSRLSGIGQTSHLGIVGHTAEEAVQKYAATGASEAQVRQFAEEIARRNGR